MSAAIVHAESIDESSPRSTLVEGDLSSIGKRVMTSNEVKAEQNPPQAPDMGKAASEDSIGVPKDNPPTESTVNAPEGAQGYRLTPYATESATHPYYLGYPPESPSNAGPPVYDSIHSFLPTAGQGADGGGGGGLGSFPNQHLSPPRAPIGIANPSASPLFPRMEARGVSPSFPYMSPGQAAMGSYYPQYPNTVSSTGSDDGSQKWPELNGQVSPAMQSYGAPLPRAMSGGRAYSFESDLLPPPATISEHDPAYSPYDSQGSQGILFPPPTWYGGPELYSNAAGASLQPRLSNNQMPMDFTGGGPMGRGVPPYGHYYQASSPGPPIQTTASNKGPDGANLFIFHIPNHFTNLDMYNLFCPYGNLLSVRIMVEKNTGRSRGFGFVSYDSPESAALAIKELNGFNIGNKRLKVQHKQIRHRDDDDYHGSSPFPGSSLPPSGSSATHLWHEEKASSVSDDGLEKQRTHPQDETTEMTSTSTAGIGEPSGDSPASPLDTVNSLQQALPTVSDKNDTAGS